MQHFHNYKTINKLNWINLEIYEKLDGFRFGFIKSDNTLKFLKRNNREIDEIDLTFFPYYINCLNKIKSISDFEIEDNIIYGFECFHPDLHEVSEFIMYQTEGSTLKNFLQTEKLNSNNFLNIQNYLKNNSIEDNYNYCVNLFSKNLIFKNPEGFVLKIKTENKDWSCKIVNPNFTEKAKLNYQEKISKISLFTEIEIQNLIKLSNQYFNKNCFEFANLIYSEIFVHKIINKTFENIEEDLFSISNNDKIDKFLYVKFTQDNTKETKQKIALYKALVMFHQKRLNEQKNI